MPPAPLASTVDPTATATTKKSEREPDKQPRLKRMHTQKSKDMEGASEQASTMTTQRALAVKREVAVGKDVADGMRYGRRRGERDSQCDAQ